MASGDGVGRLGLPRNNSETNFYSWEKLVKNFKAITGAVAAKSSAATHVSRVTDKTNAEVLDQRDGGFAQHVAHHSRSRRLHCKCKGGAADPDRALHQSQPSS
ncbi:hypothetical protein MPLB_1550023 [Mesorhizobium sp. ORS 3324]|nr:hypothetical protein MPLB_1550023 [Mesorhizobium sp. ORS 3324]